MLLSVSGLYVLEQEIHLEKQCQHETGLITCMHDAGPKDASDSAESVEPMADSVQVLFWTNQDT